jgi:methylase of polypeptide subunit release factors
MPPANDDASPRHPLVALGQLLAHEHYSFVCVTPETCRRQHARRATSEARDLRDAFGWNLPFASTLFSPRVAALLDEAHALETSEGLFVSKVRYSTLGANLFVHSAYPTIEEDSVFFGPDSYRFASFIERELSTAHTHPVNRIVDIGCGSGVGAIVARGFAPDAEIVLADINERALAYASVNAELARCDRIELVESDVFSAVKGTFDLVIANPPYMMDPLARAYRNGGGEHGAALSLRILEASLPRLNPGGRVFLYTGSAIVAGRDEFIERARRIVVAAGLRFRYAEIDPDVFGEELDALPYRDVERIAAVALVVYAD